MAVGDRISDFRYGENLCYGGEILDDYFNYSITARYEENKDAMSWLKYYR